MNMGMVITIASGKGGVGKTTSVAALSSCLAVLGKKTLCLDFDAGQGNLDLALGMTEYTIKDILDVVREGMDVSSACSESPAIPGLYYLAAPLDYIPKGITRESFEEMFTDIRHHFDFCLVDSPPGVGKGFKLAHVSTDMSVVVTTGELPSMRNAARAAKVARDLGIANQRLLVNRVVPSNYRKARLTIDDIIDNTGVQLLGIIPEDKNVFRALHENIPLVLYNRRKSVYAFLDAARRLTGEVIPLKL